MLMKFTEALAARDRAEWSVYEAMAVYEAAREKVHRRFGGDPAMLPSVQGRCLGQRLRDLRRLHDAQALWLAALEALSHAEEAARAAAPRSPP